jgi:hypothetical protein
MNVKKLFRQTIGILAVLPAALRVWVYSPFLGRDKAVARFGPSITAMAKFSLRFWIPKVATASDFSSLTSRMKSRLWLWKPFFDLSVVQDDSDTLKLKIENCPFCEAFCHLGLAEMAPYVCQGDWEIAADNADKWDFQRNYQIGTGDSFCDHTYLRRIQ